MLGMVGKFQLIALLDQSELGGEHWGIKEKERESQGPGHFGCVGMESHLDFGLGVTGSH